MQINHKFSNLSDKLKNRLEYFESQVELAFLVIVYYLKMRPVMERWSSKYVWFFYLQRLEGTGIYFVLKKV
jgi:hypothetical protein